MFLLVASSVNEARWSVASVDGAQPPPGCSRERAPIARLTFATPEHRGQERRRRRRRSTAFYGGPGGRRPRPLRYRAQATGLRGLSVALAAARHTRMVRSPKLQCQSGRPALGSSRARLRAPASAGYPSQSSTGRDSSNNNNSKERLVKGVLWCDCPVRVKVAEFEVSLRGWLRSSDIGCGF